jgi:hypothetical protein
MDNLGQATCTQLFEKNKNKHASKAKYCLKLTHQYHKILPVCLERFQTAEQSHTVSQLQ